MPLDPQAREFLERLRKSRVPSLERLPLPWRGRPSRR